MAERYETDDSECGHGMCDREDTADAIIYICQDCGERFPIPRSDYE